MNLCKSDGDCIYVDQGETKVSSAALYTSHVGSCSVLLFHHTKNHRNFMAHIDGLQSHISIQKTISQHFSKRELQERFKIYLIVGPWCNNSVKNCCDSVKIAKRVISNLDLQQKFVVLDQNQSKIDWESDIWIDKDGYSIFV